MSLIRAKARNPEFVHPYDRLNDAASHEGFQVRFRKIQMAKRNTIVEGVEIDDELREQLRSLGYLK